MVPTLINEDVFEFSYNDLKFVVQTHNYICTNLLIYHPHLHSLPYSGLVGSHIGLWKAAPMQACLLLLCSQVRLLGFNPASITH